ncbi:Chromatin structure remodeling complex protein sfh1, partial [Tulasnella sp. 419]
MRASTRKKASATPGDASVSATPPPPAIQQQPQQQPTPAISQVTNQQIQSQAQSQQSHLAQQAYYQYYQAQAAAAANAKAGAAYNPFAPAPPAGAPAMIPTPQTISTTIPTQPQSYWTTYPSRLRTGVSLLMQPIIAPPSTNVPGLGTSSGRRAARAINYAEAVSADEDDDSDDSEFGSGRARRAAAAMTGIMKGGVQGVGQQKQSNELDQSYLGKVPPTRFIASKVAVRAKHTYYSYEQMEKAATKPESLVPIRVEVDTDTHRIRDCFVWNVNEDLITPQAFATTFCQDLDLPLHHVENIVNMIRAQIEEHGGISGLDIGGGGAAEGDDDQDEDAATQEPDCRVIIR